MVIYSIQVTNVAISKKEPYFKISKERNDTGRKQF